MTPKQFYNWALKRGIENNEIIINDDDDSYNLEPDMLGYNYIKISIEMCEDAD